MTFLSNIRYFIFSFSTLFSNEKILFPVYLCYNNLIFPFRRHVLISVEITNPIILGEAIDNKKFRLNINVRLNNHTLINLEMQVAKKMNWQSRSLTYLCRSYGQLEQEYDVVSPVIHIVFLNYTLFPESPEFYITHKLINIKNTNL